MYIDKLIIEIINEIIKLIFSSLEYYIILKEHLFLNNETPVTSKSIKIY